MNIIYPIGIVSLGLPSEAFPSEVKASTMWLEDAPSAEVLFLLLLRLCLGIHLLLRDVHG